MINKLSLFNLEISNNYSNPGVIANSSSNVNTLWDEQTNPDTDGEVDISCDDNSPKDDNSGKTRDYYVVADGRRYYFASRMDCAMAKFSTVDEIKKKAVGSEPLNLKGGSNIKSNDDAVEVDSGEKTEFYMDIDNIRYYYKSSMDLMKAALSTNPSDNVSGKGRVMTQWGVQTEFYIDMDGSRYFFNSKKEKEAAMQQLEEDKGVFGMLKFNKLVAGRS